MSSVESAENNVEAQSRAELWASTMAGNHSSDVITAHKEPIQYIPFDGAESVLSTSDLLDVSNRLEIERSTYSRSATFSSKEGIRAKKETQEQHGSGMTSSILFRTNFEHDRDRILHSQPFRRLAGKTQVHLNPDDHQRTRLTHALEVAQIAKAIARALRLNETLAEAIALGHDCGHGPGGHASEDAFDIYLPGGFNHAIFGADVTLRRLNLCVETLDGIRNHSWSLNTPMTPEAEIVSFADRIAYVCHDAEDALSCEMITPENYPKHLKDFLVRSKGQQIDFFIRGVLEGTLSSGIISISKEAGEILSEYRKFNYEYIYQHPRSVEQNEHVIFMLRNLVDFYIDNFELLPTSYRQGVRLEKGDISRAVVEYVAGMTDDYASEKYELYLNN